MFYKFLRILDNRFKKTQPPVIAFGIFGLINYPLFYLYWKDITPQFYTSAWLRLVAIILCFFLVIKKYWPEKLRKYFSLYWYFTILYSLAFFGAYLFLLNHASLIWLMNIMLVIFLMILLVDWLMFFILLITGTAIGFLFYMLTTNGDLSFLLQADVLGALSTYVWTIIIGVVFSRTTYKNREINILKQRLYGMANVIAHELRTPLLNIGNSAFLSKRVLKKNKEVIPDKVFEKLEKKQNDIINEKNQTNLFINTLLENARDIENIKLTTINIMPIIEDALETFPYSNKDDLRKVHFVNLNDFKTIGDTRLLKHVIWNLLKNSLYFIHKNHKGEIFISSSENDDYNVLKFKDTAEGVAPELVDKIFEHQYTGTEVGTGIGLNFCQRVIKTFKGKIYCESELGEFLVDIKQIPNSKLYYTLIEDAEKYGFNLSEVKSYNSFLEQSND